MNRDRNTHFDLILSGGSVVLPSLKIEKLDIGITDSQITELGDLARKTCKEKLVINGLIVIPGPIDTQVHFREPGITHKEDIHHGTKGAVLGGITSIFEMPNTKPPTINKVELQKKVDIATTNAFCNFSFFMGATKENIKNLSELENLPGCCGVKIFMGSSTGDLLVEDDENLMRIFKKVKRMIAVHSEDEYRLRERENIISKPTATVLDHPNWRDVNSAVQSTKRLLKIANLTKKKIHILHLSTADEIDLLEKNKHVATCEVTPQHLFFSSPDCYIDLGTLVQMNPPIRNKMHTSGLWKGINHGIVDVIGSDHAPHTIEEKKKPYPNSPSGMTGVQTLLPIMLNFVNQNKLSIYDLVKLLCINPCRIYNIRNKGRIEIGYDADLTIIDMNKEFIISNDWIQSKSKWTPYDNLKIKGMPVFTIVNGRIVMSQNDVVSKPLGKKVNFLS